MRTKIVYIVLMIVFSLMMKNYILYQFDDENELSPAPFIAVGILFLILLFTLIFTVSYLIKYLGWWIIPVMIFVAGIWSCYYIIRYFII